jgi:hypothetical protein
MAVDLSEILPPELMRPLQKERVIEIIRALALPAYDRRILLGQWGRTVGADIQGQDINRVMQPAPVAAD